MCVIKVWRHVCKAFMVRLYGASATAYGSEGTMVTHSTFSSPSHVVLNV